MLVCHAMVAANHAMVRFGVPAFSAAARGVRDNERCGREHAHAGRVAARVDGEWERAIRSASRGAGSTWRAGCSALQMGGCVVRVRRERAGRCGIRHS
jgi:hypothetical protein